MLRVDNIHVNYGHFEALRGISLEIREGEIVALLGGNGAGKTTTINTISGMTDMYQGDITFDGASIKGLPAHERVKRGIIQVPEGRRLFPYMSVMDNLLIGSYLPQTRSKRKETLGMCFELFPRLYERKSQLAGSLSGGEQQMCAISRALMEQPKVLMLDEPSLGLAPVIVDKIFEVLITINKAGMTLLIVEQNVLASLDIATRGYVIETGENVLEGSRKELMDSGDLKKAYLGI
ncbi:MAG TPA: ABC transporter ATP-binding protein [Anaerovoracaceae bacterium]|nr:ABC transporter ATP-binding protein [Anaerovoracaceae bacterium]